MMKKEYFEWIKRVVRLRRKVGGGKKVVWLTGRGLVQCNNNISSARLNLATGGRVTNKSQDVSNEKRYWQRERNMVIG